MTREEEIKKEAKNKYPYIKGLPQTLAHQEMFIETAKWADKTMVEKACMWLEENYYNVYQGTWQEIKEQFINDFKKAMEE